MVGGNPQIQKKMEVGEFDIHPDRTFDHALRVPGARMM